MSTLAEFMIVFGAENRPPMLDKPQYESWKSCLPPDVYALVNHHKITKDIWDRVKLLMQGTSLSRQERECKLYEEFDKFSRVKGETLYQYYLRFTQLINDMNIIQITMQHVQVNTKFLNSLPPKWGKFVTDVKLARDLHTSNYDQLYAYLEQHEAHANEARFMRERFSDPLALVANYHQPPSHFNNYHSQYTTPQYQQQFSPPTQHVYSSPPQSNPYGAPHHPQQYPTTYPTNLSHTQPSVTQNAYPPPTITQQPQAEFPQLDSGLTVPTFLPGDDPIACMNKAMAFLSAVFSPRYPSTNNQLRSSSNPRNQATVQDGSQGNALGSRGNTSGQAKVVKCYNCQGEGHMARQCTQPKRRRDATWFKEKVLLVQAQAEGKELDEEQLAFLADPGVVDGQVA
ncbi:retrovirus-related pol polyprotein from transposon TNT 1-94 [Tanacetum coccineum]